MPYSHFVTSITKNILNIHIKILEENLCITNYVFIRARRLHGNKIIFRHIFRTFVILQSKFSSKCIL